MRLTRIAARVKRTSRSGFISGQKGQMLAEALVALAILGVAGVALLSGLAWTYNLASLHRERTTAESLTRTELERARTAAYPISDNTTTTSGYTVAVHAQYIDPATYENTTVAGNMQNITVTISRGGHVVWTTSAIKVR